MNEWTEQALEDAFYWSLPSDEIIRRVKQYGDYEPIKWMFRTGQTDMITSMMNDYPEFNTIVADALSGHFVGAKGIRKLEGLKKEDRNKFLLKRIHYWIDQGLSEWSATNDNNAIQKAYDDLLICIKRNHSLKWQPIEPASIYRHVWLKRNSFDWYKKEHDSGMMHLHRLTDNSAK